MSAQAEQGHQLFDGVAGCAECHSEDGRDGFSDGRYHHSGIEQIAITARLPGITQAIVDNKFEPTTIGPKVLADADWSAMGRFVVTRKPEDIGAFRTPSLRNVALTAPYMHDGSITTLADAVDHEIYYRGASRGHPIALALSERQALVAFLKSLSDAQYTKQK